MNDDDKRRGDNYYNPIEIADRINDMIERKLYKLYKQKDRKDN